MKIMTITAIALLALGLSTAEAETVSKAYEGTLATFRAPATTNGGVTFKPCSRCDYMTVRVNGATTYKINGERVSLEDFREAVAGERYRDKAYTTVLHHLESNTVVMISVLLSD